MQVTISWRHLEPSKVFEEHINKKLAHLKKFSERILSVSATLAQEGNRKSVEFQIKLSKAPLFFVKEQTYDMYQAIDSCISKAERKIKQYEDKARGRK